MKTLIFNGSPKRNGDTETLINELIKYLDGDMKILSFHDNISPCIDCRHCCSKPGCSIDDRMQEIYPYLEECDNIVIASPIWFSELSGVLLNMASRLQTYFAASYFRKEDTKVKKKNSVLILAGAQKGTETKAISTAHTFLKYLNARPITVNVFSLNTDKVPADCDAEALEQAKEAALLLNSLYLNMPGGH